jgi:hypothetical protein
MARVSDYNMEMTLSQRRTGHAAPACPSTGPACSSTGIAGDPGGAVAARRHGRC